MGLWEVLPDDARKQWAAKPLVSVGPLRFGMTLGEVYAALGEGMASVDGATAGCYPEEVGIEVYYTSADRLCGVSVDALRGPQVRIGDTALVGRVPSEIERWLYERTEGSRQAGADVVYLPGGQVGSFALGMVLCVQRAGDRLLTRPVFVPGDALDDLYHALPANAWAI